MLTPLYPLETEDFPLRQSADFKRGTQFAPVMNASLTMETTTSAESLRRPMDLTDLH